MESAVIRGCFPIRLGIVREKSVRYLLRGTRPAGALHNNYRTLFSCRWAGVLVMTACTTVLLACQYTVRDIGFVELRGPEYTLVISGSPLAEDRAGDQAARAKQALIERMAWLRDTPCQLMFGRQPTPELDLDGWLVELVDRGSRRHRLVQADKTCSPAELVDRIREAFSTPVMTAITMDAVDSFAQLVVVLGDDPDANQVVQDAANQAKLAIRRIEPMLPRPLAKPVTVLTIPAENREEESLLLWAMELENLPNARAAVAVVYGRGKLAGTVVTSEQLDERELLAQLALVGESCECETDRRWNDQPAIPTHWTRELRRRAAQGLGFDPESPLVRAEVVRIVGRGPTSSAGMSAGRPASGVDAIERLLLGYRETSLGPSQHDQTSDEAGWVEESAGVETTRILGEGWGFDSDDSVDTDTPALPIDSAAVAHDIASEAASSRLSSRLALIGLGLLGFALLSVMIAWAITRIKDARRC